MALSNSQVGAARESWSLEVDGSSLWETFLRRFQPTPKTVKPPWEFGINRAAYTRVFMISYSFLVYDGSKFAEIFLWLQTVTLHDGGDIQQH